MCMFVLRNINYSKNRIDDLYALSLEILVGMNEL